MSPAAARFDLIVVDTALREAAGKAKGRQLVGIIGSLGVRRDHNAVALMTRHLGDSDAEVVKPPLGRWGRIGTLDASKALEWPCPRPLRPIGWLYMKACSAVPTSPRRGSARGGPRDPRADAIRTRSGPGPSGCQPSTRVESPEVRQNFFRRSRENRHESSHVSPGGAAGLARSSLQRHAAEFAAQEPKRVGLIGCGWYGKSDLFRLIQVAPVEVVSLCDVDTKMLAEAAEMVATRQASKKTAAHLRRLPRDAHRRRTSTSSWSPRPITGTRCR